MKMVTKCKCNNWADQKLQEIENEERKTINELLKRSASKEMIGKKH